MNALPKIALVDDHAEELTPLSALLNESKKTISGVYQPNDIDSDLLKTSDLIIVDYTLDSWLDAANLDSISLTPPNGIALAAVLREHSKQLKQHPPTAFALITGQPGSLGPLPAELRPHIVSRLNNLEWYFEKASMGDPNTIRQMESLAEAVAGLPESIETELSDMTGLIRFLGASKHDLEERLSDSVQRCYPPMHQLAERSHGLIILRWLLHSILPHVTFLLDERALAARLYSTRQSLQEALRREPFVAFLKSLTYDGPLADFDGERWWRDGIEQLLWDVSDGNSADASKIRASIERETGVTLEPLEIVRPVLTVDADFAPEEDPSSSSAVVPLQLDGWPAYAEPPYLRKSVLEERPELAIFVDDSAD